MNARTSVSANITYSRASTHSPMHTHTHTRTCALLLSSPSPPPPRYTHTRTRTHSIPISRSPGGHAVLAHAHNTLAISRAFISSARTSARFSNCANSAGEETWNRRKVAAALFMYICTYVYMYMYMYMYMFVHIHIYIHIYIHT